MSSEGAARLTGRYSEPLASVAGGGRTLVILSNDSFVQDLA